MRRNLPKATGFLPKKQDFKADSGVNPQSGSAIIWIFLMIAIFAALNYAVSSGSRSGATQITTEQAKLTAAEILDYGRALKNAVQTLQINGCNDTEISFDQAVVTGYSNPNSPDDDSCDIFSPAGGGMRLTKIPEPLRAETIHDYPRFVANTNVLNMGTLSSELHLWIRTISREACMQYNVLNDIDNIGNDAPVEGGFLATPLFTGTYAETQTFGDDNNGTNFLGHTTGCHKDSSEVNPDGQPYYDYYYVLIVR